MHLGGARDPACNIFPLCIICTQKKGEGVHRACKIVCVLNGRPLCNTLTMFVCFVQVFCVFCVVYFLRSPVTILAASMCFLECGAEKALCIQYVSSINNTNTHTKHVEYRDKTHYSTPGGEINTIQTG